MKQVLLAAILLLTLCGCGAQETMETVDDSLVVPAAAVRREISVELPGEAAVPALESDTSRYYICNGYEISLETFPSGDVQQTIRSLTGYDPGDLTVVETESQGVERYDFTWAAQGEEGQRLGRAAILDDGNYLYTLSVLRDAENKENSQVVWRTVFESFKLQ